ncbi:MAG: four helix bundle protein [Candidatus Sulfotelmatobacter sp.]
MGPCAGGYRNTSSFPKQEIYGLTSQMRPAAVSIPSNIAEYRRGQGAFFLAKSCYSSYSIGVPCEGIFVGASDSNYYRNASSDFGGLGTGKSLQTWLRKLEPPHPAGEPISVAGWARAAGLAVPGIRRGFKRQVSSNAVRRSLET